MESDLIKKLEHENEELKNRLKLCTCVRSTIKNFDPSKKYLDPSKEYVVFLMKDYHFELLRDGVKYNPIDLHLIDGGYGFSKNIISQI